MKRHLRLTKRVRDKKKFKFDFPSTKSKENVSLSEHTMEVNSSDLDRTEVIVAKLRAEFQEKILELQNSFNEVLLKEKHENQVRFDQLQREIEEHKKSNANLRHELEMKLSGVATTNDLQQALTEVAPKVTRILMEELKTLLNFKFVTTPTPGAVCLYVKLSTGPRFDDDTFTLDEQNEINSRRTIIVLMKAEALVSNNTVSVNTSQLKFVRSGFFGKESEQRAVIRFITTAYSTTIKPMMHACEHNALNKDMLNTLLLKYAEENSKY